MVIDGIGDLGIGSILNCLVLRSGEGVLDIEVVYVEGFFGNEFWCCMMVCLGSNG